jgi:phage terminase small subunit
VEIYAAADGTMTLKEAALEAGYPLSNAANMGSQLTNPEQNPHVVAAIQRRRAELNAKYGTTFERHMKDLQYIRDKAIEAGAWAAAVQAEYRRGQALGTIYVDRKEIRHGSIDSMSKEEVQRKLDALKKLYQGSSDVVDVQITESIDRERTIDHSEEFVNETGSRLLSEGSEGDDASEDNPG